MKNYLLKKGCILQIFGIPVNLTQDVVVETGTDLKIIENTIEFKNMKKIFPIENDKITVSLADMLENK